MRTNELERWLIARTELIVTARRMKQEGLGIMPIKWNVTGKAMKARGLMDQISAEYDGFIEGGSEHLADVKGLRSQVGEMQDDLQSAANVMGNSGGGSDTGQEKPKEPLGEKQVITASEVGKLNAESVVGQPAPIGNQRAFDRIGG